VTDRPAKAVHRAPSFPADPDAEHLLRLLAILPGSEQVAFWNQIDAHGLLPDAEATAEDLEPSGNGYLLGKMTGHIRAALAPDAPDSLFASLASYTLMFFWGEHPALWKALESLVPSGSFTGDGGFGRRYAQDLCDAAWKVAVRYHHGYRADAAALLAKWPDERHGEGR
jgi:hypothetical protein